MLDTKTLRVYRSPQGRVVALRGDRPASGDVLHSTDDGKTFSELAVKIEQLHFKEGARVDLRLKATDPGLNRVMSIQEFTPERESERIVQIGLARYAEVHGWTDLTVATPLSFARTAVSLCLFPSGNMLCLSRDTYGRRDEPLRLSLGRPDKMKPLDVHAVEDSETGGGTRIVTSAGSFFTAEHLLPEFEPRGPRWEPHDGATYELSPLKLEGFVITETPEGVSVAKK